MKKLIGFFIVLFCSTAASAQFSGGNGTENNPYIINTAAELAQLATYVNAGNEDYNACHYKLNNNIDLSNYQSGQGWIPIGVTDGAYNIHPFSGVFDGNNKMINGLIINATSQNMIGLFGYVSDGKIINLGIEDAEVSVSNTATWAGIVAGAISNSTILNCYSTGTVSANSTMQFALAGGLAGIIGQNSLVINCFSTSAVSAITISDEAHAGGFAGMIAENSIVSNCYSTGMVSAYSNYYYAISGGFAGSLFNGSTLSNCYSTGKIYAKSVNEVANAGGMIGYLDYQNNISNCVAINPIVICTGAYEYFGRVVGYNYYGTISFNLGFESMYNSNGNEWSNIGGNNLDGETISKAQIMADGTFDNRFTAANGWTTQNGKLPGFGAPVDLPDFLTQPTVVNIKITPTKTLMKQGTTQQFEADVFVFNNAPTSVTWSVVGGVSGTGITQNGLLTVANNETALQFTVVATSTFDNTIKGIATVYVSYVITTAEQLAQVATNVNSGNSDFTSGYFILGNDIDLSIYQSGSGWTPIGKDEKMFQGVFDGNNKKITGLKINTTEYNAYVGLFGYVYNGTIKNLGIENADVYRGNTANNNFSYVGIFAGCFYRGTVSNCYATGTVSSNSTGVSRTAYAGGLVGVIYGTTITNCYTEGSINAYCIGYYADAGGLVGEMQYSTVSNSYSTASVTANSSGNRITKVGGVAGFLWHSTMSNCYSTGTVSSSSTTSCVGGVAGDLYLSTVLNCAALNPDISCKDKYGRVVGRLEGYGAGTCISNIAFAGMLNPSGNTTWNNIGASNKDGETITCEEFLSDGTFGGRFTSEGGWTTQNGKLPGLFGNTVDLPVHLCSSGYPPVITSIALPGGTVGVEYNHILDAWGNLPILWAIETGNLPESLHLFDTGEISGTPTTEGTFNFIVKAMNNYGFDTKAFSITIKPLENHPIIVSNDGNGTASANVSTATMGAVITLTATPNKNYKFAEWKVISGGITITTPTVTPATFTMPNNAVEVKATFTEDVGITETEIETIKVYPNPTGGELRIESSRFKVQSIEIFDIYGKKVQMSPVSFMSPETVINIFHLSAGVYFVRIQTETGEVVRKVLKE